MAAEESKSSEEKKENTSLISVSVNASDILGHGEGMSKLFDTIGARLGQVFSGVGDFVNVIFLEKKRIDNDAYRTRELGAAQADATQSQWRAIAPIVDSGQQLQALGIDSGKVTVQLTGASPEFVALHQRSVSRLAVENAMHQLNLESATYYAAEALADAQNVSSESVVPDWVNHWTGYARNASSEEMQRVWGQILAGEIKAPGSFSPRTLQFISLLTQKEAQLFQRASAFCWRTHYGELAITLLPAPEGNRGDLIGFTQPEIQLLTNLGLIEIDLRGGYGYRESRVELLYNKSVIDLEIVDKSSFISLGHANLTPLGIELVAVCRPEYDECVVDEAVKFWVLKGYQVSSPNHSLQPPKPLDIKKPAA